LLPGHLATIIAALSMQGDLIVLHSRSWPAGIGSVSDVGLPLSSSQASIGTRTQIGAQGTIAFGIGVGEDVGRSVGWSVGKKVGVTEGLCVGAIEGISVGAAVGSVGAKVKFDRSLVVVEVLVVVLVVEVVEVVEKGSKSGRLVVSNMPQSYW